VWAPGEPGLLAVTAVGLLEAGAAAPVVELWRSALAELHLTEPWAFWTVAELLDSAAVALRLAATSDLRNVVLIAVSIAMAAELAGSCFCLS
jgi:hypothetical protein